MRLWVFSDLHLTSPSDSLYQAFLLALDEPASSDDIVVLAGDIFDLFVGHSERFVSKNQDFLDKLAQLRKKRVRVYYIEGNHDFHLDQVLDPIGVERVDEELVISIPDQDKKIYIAHGDLVDSSDTGYLKLRALFRHPVSRWIIQHAPGSWVEWVAARLSRSPAKQHEQLPEKWLASDRTRLREIYRTFARQKVSAVSNQIGFVILGHCHDLDEEGSFYWNMGYPPVHRQFLYYDSTSDCVKRREFPRIS